MSAKFPDYSNIRTDYLDSGLLPGKDIRVAVLRLDLLHPQLSGNKWFKLKYNLLAAQEENKDAILSFGGAYSNHIAATAHACKMLGLKSIGIIRGEEPPKWGHTLLQAKSDEMELHFLPREQYDKKESQSFIASLRERFGNIFIIPEGGNNALGIKGAAEILSCGPSDLSSFTHICCAVGTGATVAGLASAANDNQSVMGFPVLKNEPCRPSPFPIITGYHFGGYAKSSPALFRFMNKFYEDFNIPLDFVYTGKMVYGVMDLISKNYFPAGSNLLVIHSGGLQGNLSLPRDILFF